MRKVPDDVLDDEDYENVRKALVHVSFTIHPDMLYTIDDLRGRGEPGARPRSQQLCLMLEDALKAWDIHVPDEWTEHVQLDIGYPKDKNNVVVFDFKKVQSTRS